jgi:transposase-like protein
VAVEVLARKPGRTVAEVGRSLGIDRSVLSAWKYRLEPEGAAGAPGRGRPRASEGESQRLPRELTQARQECDILGRRFSFREGF